MKLIKLARNFMFNDIFNQERNVSKFEKFVSVYFNIDYDIVHNNLKLIPRKLPKNKRNIAWMEVDLLLTLENKKININIEINNRYDSDVVNRNIIYISKIASNGYKEGESYKDIWMNKQINFNEKQITGNKLIQEYVFKEKETNEILSDVIEIDIINVAFLDRVCYTKLSEKEKIVYNFCKMLVTEDETIFKEASELVMNEQDSKDLLSQVKEKSGHDEYVEMASTFSSQENYEEHLKEMFAKEGKEEGRKEGRKEGIKEGFKQGHEEGFNEGRKEGKEEGKEEGIYASRVEVAKNMIFKEYSNEEISEITGLSIEEIIKLKN